MPEGPRVLPGAAGRVTARGAVELAEGVMASLDPARRLTQIVSDSNITPEGLALGWELRYDLPSRDHIVMLTLDACPDTLDDPEPALCVSLWENPRLTLERFGRPALPTPFRDSPEAMADFMAQGLPLVSGSTDVTLSSGRLEDGSVVWEVQTGGDRSTTSFRLP